MKARRKSRGRKERERELYCSRKYLLRDNTLAAERVSAEMEESGAMS